MQGFWKKITQLFERFKAEQVKGAQKTLLEELFNDFYAERRKIYRVNFFRGIFFGLGSVLGGTLVVALLVGLLNFTGHLVPGIADFLNNIIDVMQRSHR